MSEHIHARFCLPFSKSDFQLDVDLRLPRQGVTAIFGPSGSGKTTLLRCIAGLQHSPVGELYFGGDCWQRGRHRVPCHRRPIAYVFQEASLFPHLNVAQNLRYALRRAAADGPSLAEVCELLALDALMERRPDRLSGGERQRVAIARALLIAPRLLLMDEPLSGLDPARKAEILPFLEQLCRQSNIPILYVSHSVDEVCRLADHLVVMNDGRVIDQGPLEKMLIDRHLSSDSDSDVSALLRAEVEEIDTQWQLARLAFDGGHLWVRSNGESIGSELRLRIRAQDISITLSAPSDSSILNILPSSIVAISDEPGGAMQLLQLAIGNSHLLARLTRRSVHQLGLRVGMPVYAQLKSVAIIR